VLDNINLLLDRARTSGTPVIYVQHNEPKGGELEPGTPKWPIPWSGSFAPAKSLRSEAVTAPA